MMMQMQARRIFLSASSGCACQHHHRHSTKPHVSKFATRHAHHLFFPNRRKPLGDQKITIPVPHCAASSNATNEQPQQQQFGIRQITGDGSCLFRALAQGSQYCSLLDANQPLRFLNPKEETEAATALRQLVCDALLARASHFSPFITGPPTFEEYVSTMRKSSTFGGEPEIVAAADVVGRPITIFTVDRQLQQIRLFKEYLPSGDSSASDRSSSSNASEENEGENQQWPIPLLYSPLGEDSGHYDLIAPIQVQEEQEEE